MVDAQLRKNAKITSFRASVFGDDGSCYSLDSNEPLILPVGNYTLGQFSIRIKPSEGRPWSFSFSHTGRAAEQVWYSVEEDDNVTIPLFGKLLPKFSAPLTVPSGGAISIRPTLMTEDGLYITYSGRGEPDTYGQMDDNTGKFTVKNDSDEQIGKTESGFA